MFGPKPIQLPAVPFGPLEVFMPDAGLLTDQKAKAQYQEVRHVYLDGPRFTAAARELSTSLGRFIERYVVPDLPSASDLGRDESEWPPVDKIAAAMGFAMTLSDVRLGKVPLGCASPGTVLAAHAYFADLDDDPVVDALLSWLSWASFVARTNGLAKMDLVDFLRECLRSSDDLEQLASTH